MFGWFKPELQNPAISNIVTLKNVSGSSLFIKSVFGSFPPCPFKDEEREADDSLNLLPEVVDNPNCFPDQVASGDKEDLLYVNYDLNPVDNGDQTYSLSFLIR